MDLANEPLEVEKKNSYPEQTPELSDESIKQSPTFKMDENRFYPIHETMEKAIQKSTPRSKTDEQTPIPVPIDNAGEITLTIEKTTTVMHKDSEASSEIDPSLTASLQELLEEFKEQQDKIVKLFPSSGSILVGISNRFKELNARSQIFTKNRFLTPNTVLILINLYKKNRINTVKNHHRSISIT